MHQLPPIYRAVNDIMRKQAEFVASTKKIFYHDIKSKVSLVRDLVDAERDFDATQTRLLEAEDRFEKV